MNSTDKDRLAADLSSRVIPIPKEGTVLLFGNGDVEVTLSTVLGTGTFGVSVLGIVSSIKDSESARLEKCDLRWEPRVGDFVAIKFFSAKLSRDRRRRYKDGRKETSDQYIDRITLQSKEDGIREAEVAQYISHASRSALGTAIFAPLYFGTLPDLGPFIVFETVEAVHNLSLTDPAFVADNAVELATEITRCVRVIHECGWSHGDIKPGNIVWWRRMDGRISVRIVDIGTMAPFAGQKNHRYNIFSRTTWCFADPLVCMYTDSFVFPCDNPLKAIDVWSLGMVISALSDNRILLQDPKRTAPPERFENVHDFDFQTALDTPSSEVDTVKVLAGLCGRDGWINMPEPFASLGSNLLNLNPEIPDDMISIHAEMACYDENSEIIEHPAEKMKEILGQIPDGVSFGECLAEQFSFGYISVGEGRFFKHPTPAHQPNEEILKVASIYVTQDGDVTSYALFARPLWILRQGSLH